MASGIRIRNRPLETTLSPSARPERNAVTPCDAWKTATRFGTKRIGINGNHPLFAAGINQRL
ncbi:hypothetical protein ACLB1R_16515 [Escherichia coli]